MTGAFWFKGIRIRKKYFRVLKQYEEALAYDSLQPIQSHRKTKNPCYPNGTRPWRTCCEMRNECRYGRIVHWLQARDSESWTASFR